MLLAEPEPMTQRDFRLSADDVKRFHEQGYLGPFAICSPEEMAAIRERIDREVLPTPGPNKKQPLQCRHLDQRLIWDLITRPQLVDRMKSIFGQHLICWATYFFNKPPGGSEIPWHQDINYWPIEPALNLSAWIAIDEVTRENSCVNLIPGSHKKMLSHVKSSDGMAFGEMADVSGVDLSKQIAMELKPGEFFLFTERLLHQSNKNVSQKRRLGLSVRVTLPIVRIDQDVPPLFPGHEVLVMSGRDDMGFNRMGTPPEEKVNG